MLVSNVLFETAQASLFRIPRGEVSLQHWNPADVVWKGGLRLIEEEDTDVADESAACLALRLKIELRSAAGPEPRPWAEVWYNPFRDHDLAYSVSNDGSDTVTMTPESARYYRLVLQLPNSGYHPAAPGAERPEALLQVALGLSFADSLTASSFSESLAVYKRHFRNFQEKFVYERHLAGLQQKIKDGLSLSPKHSPTPVSDPDDDFGTFVSSYD